VFLEVQTANHKQSNHARDPCKTMEAMPRTAMDRMALQSRDQMPVSASTFRRVARLADAINFVSMNFKWQGKASMLAC
jgi:hypothetical protein